MNESTVITFEKHQNFHLVPLHWGEAIPIDLMRLLDNAATTFYGLFDPQHYSNKQVVIMQAKFFNELSESPKFIQKENLNTILLSSVGKYWGQHAYQFAHELCHHICQTEFRTDQDRFGWLEESLCELASIVTLQRMAKSWLTAPPYLNWTNYATSLRQYADGVIQKFENLNTRSEFQTWLLDQLNDLQADRYLREANGLIALQLLPLFEYEPLLWQALHYLKQVEVTNNLQLPEYLECWRAVLPENLKGPFKDFSELFNC